MEKRSGLDPLVVAVSGDGAAIEAADDDVGAQAFVVAEGHAVVACRAGDLD